jgi:Cd2+/Zn2+-exporting ATPase/Cu+-exporting ATPase
MPLPLHDSDYAPSRSLADQADARLTAPAAPDDHTAHDDGHDLDPAHAFDWQEALRIVVVALAAATVWFRLWEPFNSFGVIGGIGLVVGGWPIFKEAIENAWAKRIDLEPGRVGRTSRAQTRWDRG